MLRIMNNLSRKRSHLERTGVDAEKYLVGAKVSPWTQPAQWLDQSLQESLGNLRNPSHLAHIQKIGLFHHLSCLLLNIFDERKCDPEHTMKQVLEILAKLEVQNGTGLLISARDILETLLLNLASVRVSIESPECQRALVLDLIDLWAYALDILAKAEEKEYLFNRIGNDAQELIGLFQSMLDYTDLGGRMRNRVLRALIRLSQNNKFCPESIGFAPVEKISKSPVKATLTVDIYTGEYAGQKCAVKVFRQPIDKDNDTYRRNNSKNSVIEKLEGVFIQEALIWRQLSDDSLVPFIGFFATTWGLGFVSPWMPNGNIIEYFRTNDNIDRMRLIHQITLGIEYLHSVRLAHGDIKPGNILVDDTGRARLTDFGLAYALRDSFLDPTRVTGHGGGTKQYVAPEALSGKIICESDLWSFASTVYEIFTGYTPFHNVRSELAFLKKITSGNPPPKPDVSSIRISGLEIFFEQVWEQLVRCWALRPEERPKACHLQTFFATTVTFVPSNY